MKKSNGGEKVRKRTMAIMLAAIMVLTVVIPMTANSAKYIDKNNQYQKTFNTEALIEGNYDDPIPGEPTDDGPVVEYCWILPDEDDQTDCVQIHINPSGWRNDIYAWLVVTDTNGKGDIAQVFAQVFFPRDVPTWCGSEKFKASELAENRVTSATEIRDAMDAALYSEHLTKPDCEDIEAIVFTTPIAYVFKVQLPMEYCEPAGVYKVRMWATDGDSHPSEYCYATFQWKEAVVLQYDFGVLNFGSIEAGVEQPITGDEFLNTPLLPTVKNEGNTKIHMQIKSQEMVNQDDEQYKITEFDVRWMGKDFVYNTDGQTSDWTAWLELDPDLCLCQTKPIGFSVHPDHSLPPGVYKGKLTIHVSKGDWGEDATGKCHTDPWPLVLR